MSDGIRMPYMCIHIQHTYTHTHTRAQHARTTHTETYEKISLTVILRTSLQQRRVLGAGVERER